VDLLRPFNTNFEIDNSRERLGKSLRRSSKSIRFDKDLIAQLSGRRIDDIAGLAEARQPSGGSRSQAPQQDD